MFPCSRYLRRLSEAARPHDNVSSISFSCIYSSSKLKFACLRPARVCFVFCEDKLAGVEGSRRFTVLFSSDLMYLTHSTAKEKKSRWFSEVMKATVIMFVHPEACLWERMQDWVCLKECNVLDFFFFFNWDCFIYSIKFSDDFVFINSKCQQN